TREYHAWADWLGIPRHTFSAVFGAVIARGEDYRTVFQHFRPGFDLDTERQARIDAGLGEYFNADDLYPDVRPCLPTLQEAGSFPGHPANPAPPPGRVPPGPHPPRRTPPPPDRGGPRKPRRCVLPQPHRGRRPPPGGDLVRRRPPRLRHPASQGRRPAHR